MMNSALLIFVAILVIVVLLPFFALLRQYAKHKAPLKAIDPSVKYGLWHHMQIVTFPMMRYRIASKFNKTKKVSANQPVVEPTKTEQS